MSFLQLSTGLVHSLPSSIHNRKAIINHSAFSCTTKFAVCNAWGSKCANPKKKDDVQNTRLPLQLDDRRQQLAANCTKSSGEVDASLNRTKISKDDDMRTKFMEVYSVLKSEVLNDEAFEWTHDSRLWVEQMLDYNVPGGKHARGYSVINSYKLLKEGKELSEDEVFDAFVVGWCIEWYEAASLILDDFTDTSQTRRDQACWYKLPNVGNIAVNDAILLTAQVPRILKKHFGEKPYYVDLLDLFNEVVFLTTSGQMLDLTTPNEERDLSNYSMHTYRRIALYKAGYFSCYLPVGCAILLAGDNLEKHLNMKNVLLEMGIYFQILNDYLDCFGNPEKTGKIGTDIEDFNCSWLVVKAMELANEDQKKILQEHYGKPNPYDVAKVKDVYNDINLQSVFAAYESEVYDELTTCVEAHPNKALHGIWARFATYRQLFKIQDS